MRAATFSEFGGPEVIRLINRPVPSAQRGEVVVRVAAATVNPTDTLMRAGRQAAMMSGLVPPFVAGMEFAGCVHAVGDGVTSPRVGESVIGLVNPRRPEGGAQADYVVAPAASVVGIDDTVDFAEAATLPMNGMTAIMVIDALNLPSGSSVLITGAAGAVGMYVIELAKLAGLSVIADAKPSDSDLLCKLGADHIVPRGDAFGPAVRALRPAGVDGLVDAALLGNRAAALVRGGGRAVTLRRASPITDQRLDVRHISVSDSTSDTASLRRLADLHRMGQLTARVGRRLPLAEAAAAHRLVEQGGMRGRVVLITDDGGV
jgi:NADPH:quinone reductase-like Zn-dependent oxidoreductase